MNSKRQVDIIAIGLEHFIDKIGYQAQEYQRRGVQVRYLVQDAGGMSAGKSREYGADVVVLPKPAVARLWQVFKELWHARAKSVELYDTGRLTVFYAVMVKVFRFGKLVLILRGLELTKKPGQPKLRHWGIEKTLQVADHIVAKEFNIIDALKQRAIDPRLVTFIGNCVPYPNQDPSPWRERSIDILFLNSVRKSRHVDILIKAIPQVFAALGPKKVVIAGFTHLNAEGSYRIEVDEEKRILALIDALALRDKIELKGFVNDPHHFLQDAKIFVLPGDVIFANYTLLEAMSFGVVPIVGDGEGANLIIENGVNGVIAARDADAVAKAMIMVLNDDPLAQSLAKAARQTILEKFSMRRWGGEILAVHGLRFD